MRGGSSRLRGNAGWRRRDIELAKAGSLMREAGFVGCDSDPIVAYAHYDRQGRPRRAHAQYENGWRATLCIRINGDCSLSQAIRLLAEPLRVDGL